MNMIKNLQLITFEEFNAMEKNEDTYYELIDGEIMMAPSPTFEHQQIGGNIVSAAKIKLKGICVAIYEYDLKIDDYNFYKPDVALYCQKDKQIPEIVFEILSPSTKQKDFMVKPTKYKSIGVKEYWIIDPLSQTVIVHFFVEDGTDEINIYTLGKTIQSKIYSAFSITVEEIFEDVELV